MALTKLLKSFHIKIVVLHFNLHGLIKILDKTFEVFIESEELQREIQSLAKEINAVYKGKDVVFLAVLNGAFMFTADLMKQIDLDCEISFIKMSSYHGTQSTGTVEELIGLSTDISGKHVVIIEDIVDTGITIDKIITLLDNYKPESVAICTLLFKPDAFQGNKNPDFVGFAIPNAFVVGYGLDYNEHGRNLNTIYQIRNEY